MDDYGGLTARKDANPILASSAGLALLHNLAPPRALAAKWKVGNCTVPAAIYTDKDTTTAHTNCSQQLHSLSRKARKIELGEAAIEKTAVLARI